VEDSLNAFAVECFIDELAAAAGRDPLDYRLALLSGGRRLRTRDGGAIETGRLAKVLVAADAAARQHSELPPGRARGVACHACRGSYLAVVAEVSAAGAEVRVHHLWAAVDCGRVINPLGAEAQIEGGLQFGTSAALHEAITLQDRVVQQSNFHEYRLLRISESPQTSVLILPSDAPPGGVGEIAVPPVAPALANALFRLSGERRRRLPLNAEVRKP
jgi:isoquinoline 1-oxidoreductase subunit beta